MRREENMIHKVALLLCFMMMSGIIAMADSSKSKNTAKKISVGDYVTLGRYEQDNKEANGPEAIEWLVLDKKTDKALLLSRLALEKYPFHESGKGVDWEKSDIRKWLNSSFLIAAFTEEEREAILETLVDNSRRQGQKDTEKSGGSNTTDKVFLLSYAEAKKYLPSREQRICAMTEYVKEKDKFDPYYARWWLRSPGEWDRRELEVYIDGDMGGSGVEVDYGNGTARPAMWVAMAALKPVGTDSIPYLAETTTSLKEAIEEVAKGRTLNEQIVLLNEITSLYSEEITKTDWGEELDRIRVNAKKEDLIPKVNKAKKAKLSAKLFQNKKIITLYDNQGDFYLLGDFYVRIPEKHRATSLQEANGIIYLKQEFERRTDYTGPAFDRLYDVYWIERKSRKAVKIYSECSSPPFSGYGTLYGKEIPLETIWDDIKEFIK